MKPDFEQLYLQMARMRYFEEALAGLWHRGLVPGEMHLGVGEEAVVAGVLAHLRHGDALSLDHRSTPPLVARGVDMSSMILECIGDESGLCGGQGGHMHLFSREHLAGSSGIVGSSAPLAAGFGLAAQLMSPGAVAFAFFGDGAANQGMLLESFNLAVAWRLPVVFVCKDNHWAITTRSRSVTGGCLRKRAQSFGMPAVAVDGTRVDAVWNAAARAVNKARSGRGPSFLLARCCRPEGHFLGDPLLRIFREPVKQVLEITPPIVRAMLSKPLGALALRCGHLGRIGAVITRIGGEVFVTDPDPLARAARLVGEDARRRLEDRAHREVGQALEAAMERRSRHV